jgi:hypothetical protein
MFTRSDVLILSPIFVGIGGKKYFGHFTNAPPNSIRTTVMLLVKPIANIKPTQHNSDHNPSDDQLDLDPVLTNTFLEDYIEALMSKSTRVVVRITYLIYDTI